MADTLPDYSQGSIPAGTYAGQANDVATLSSTAFVIADRGLPDAVAERLTEAVFTGLGELRRLHLAFGDLDEAALLAPCPDVPYHPGALAYFARPGSRLRLSLTGPGIGWGMSRSLRPRARLSAGTTRAIEPRGRARARR
jgi:TRAP-type uncharacterized transport system substrate-binding protein